MSTIPAGHPATRSDAASGIATHLARPLVAAEAAGWWLLYLALDVYDRLRGR